MQLHHERYTAILLTCKCNPISNALELTRLISIHNCARYNRFLTAVVYDATVRCAALHRVWNRCQNPLLKRKVHFRSVRQYAYVTVKVHLQQDLVLRWLECVPDVHVGDRPSTSGPRDYAKPHSHAFSSPLFCKRQKQAPPPI